MFKSRYQSGHRQTNPSCHNQLICANGFECGCDGAQVFSWAFLRYDTFGGNSDMLGPCQLVFSLEDC